MNRTAKPVHIELVPSRLLAAGLVGVYGAALIVVSMSPFPVLVCGMAAFVLLMTAWRNLVDCLQTGPKQRIRQLVLQAQDDWIIINGAGVATRGRPSGVMLAHPWMVSVTLTDEGGKSTPVLVLPDMTSRPAYHRLRLWLRRNPQTRFHDRHA